MSMEGKKGFTLIELLIVVAIIAILAAIAVPNFLEAQVRSKVSRVKADMRAIVLAMEAYFVDHNAYPPLSDFVYPGPPFEQQDPWWRPLTSPVAYMTALPRDPFQSATRHRIVPWTGGFIHYDPFWNTWDGALYYDARGQHYGRGYVVSPTWGPYSGFRADNMARGFWYVLWSVGPDGDCDFGGGSGDGYGRPPGDTKASAMACFYDPSNGTVSSGDIVRLGPGASDHITW